MICQFIVAAEFISINGFIIISSYYLAFTRSTVKKIVKFDTQLVFFGIVLYLAGMVAVGVHSPMMLIKSIFPLLGYHWWYAIAYVILLVAAPYLNKFLDSISKIEHRRLILISVVVIQIFLKCNPFIGDDVFIGHFSHSIIWFIQIYIIAGYIRRYDISYKKSLMLCVMLASTVLLLLLNHLSYSSSLPSLLSEIDLTSDSSLFPLVGTVSSFLLFKELKFSKVKEKGIMSGLMNIVVSSVFGVYLIQEHNSIRGFLWGIADIDSRVGLGLVMTIVLVFLILLVISVIITTTYNFCAKIFIDRYIEWTTDRLSQLEKKTT